MPRGLAKDNIRWQIYPDAHHNFDGSTPRPYFPQGVTAKNCSIEVFLTDVKGGGLGEARNYKTGQPIQGLANGTGSSQPATAVVSPLLKTGQHVNRR